MAEFSERTGTPVATLKYYIREGLVPPGRHTATNQAVYDEQHVARVELIRALREVADLPIATIRDTFAVMAVPRGDGPDHLGVALQALGAPLTVPPGHEDAYHSTAQRVDAILATLGWHVPDDSSAYADLIRALVAIDQHFAEGVSDQRLLEYARSAQHLAELEIPRTWNPDAAPANALRYAVLGTVLFEPVITALRRLAHADRHRRLAASHRRQD